MIRSGKQAALALVAAALLTLSAGASAAFRSQTVKPTRPQAGLPTWPQRFEVRGPEAASYGFAVTQPGPIVIDVRSQGPIKVQLLGPNKLEQVGNGRVVLQYNVTPDDVQRGVLWTAAITQQANAPSLAGEITVQSPPPDPATLQRAMQAQPKPTQQQIEQQVAADNARFEQVIAARKQQFAQQVTSAELADQQRFRASLPTLTAAPNAAIQSRAIAPQTAGTSKLVIDRPAPTAPVMRPITTPPAQPAPPPFQITSLSEDTGGPRKGIAIYGTSFGTNPGLVWLTIPPGHTPPCDPACQQRDQVAGQPSQHEAKMGTVLSWNDNTIIVELPEVTNVMPYQAQVFLNKGSQQSNRLPFSFVPRQQLRVIRTIPNDRRHSSSVVTIPMVLPPNMHHQRNFAIPFGEFVGEKGDDEYFLRTQLKNGWTVSSVRIIPMTAALGKTPQEVSSALSVIGGAYVQQPPSGTNPYFSVRWWLNAFQPFLMYRIAVEITGPEGVPDGIEVM